MSRSKKESKLYRVNIDLLWSQDYIVTAKSRPEAKRKAIEKFRRVSRANLSVTSEELSHGKL